MKLTDDRSGLKLQKNKRFCAIKGDTYDFFIGAPLQTLGAPNTPLWIVHSDPAFQALCYQFIITTYSPRLNLNSGVDAPNV